VTQENRSSWWLRERGVPGKTGKPDFRVCPRTRSPPGIVEEPGVLRVTTGESTGTSLSSLVHPEIRDPRVTGNSRFPDSPGGRRVPGATLKYRFPKSPGNPGSENGTPGPLSHPEDSGCHPD